MIEKHKEVRYNEICCFALEIMYMRARNHSRISLLNFNPTRKDHMFVYHIAAGLSGVMSKPIATDLGFWKRRKFNKNIKLKECKLLPANNSEDYVHGIYVNLLIDDLNKMIAEEGFTLDDIYEEFYSGKELK